MRRIWIGYQEHTDQVGVRHGPRSLAQVRGTGIPHVVVKKPF